MLDTLIPHFKGYSLFINIQIDKEPEHIWLVALTQALLGNRQVSKLKGEVVYAAISNDTPSIERWEAQSLVLA